MMTRNQLATLVEGISLVSDQRSMVNACISIALDRVFKYHDWPYYMQDDFLETTVDYNTGTITTIKGSKVVTGSATTVWTSAMNGRKFRVGSENPYYIIDSVTAVNSLTLKQNYQGDGGTLQGYEIYKDEYRLKPDIHKLLIVRQIQNNIAMYQDYPSDFDKLIPTPNNLADPTRFMIIGTRLDVYTTGTVSALGHTITGVGTSWDTLEGLGRCSKIRIGTDVYTIKSVDSALQLTTYESVTTAPALSTYEISLDNIRIQVYQIPDATRNLYYRYTRKPAVLANDYDIPDMPERYHELLLWGALSEVLSHKGDINKAENMYESRFLNGLNQMKLSIGSFSPDKIWVRKTGDRIHRPPRGLEASNFDIKYSSP